VEKCVEDSLKLLEIVSKIWTPFRKLFAPLVPQTGYGPEPTKAPPCGDGTGHN